jgi:predicted Zn-dependent peptidase
MQAAIDVLQGRSANHWRRYDSLVDAVTVDDLAAFARLHFKASARTQLVVRP